MKRTYIVEIETNAPERGLSRVDKRVVRALHFEFQDRLSVHVINRGKPPKIPVGADVVTYDPVENADDRL